MITVYYLPASASFTSSATVYLDAPPSPPITVFSDVTLQIVSGAYNVYTGSSVAASYPVNDTVVYYNIEPASISGDDPLPPTQSSFPVAYSFTPSTTTPTNTDTFTIVNPLYSASFSESLAGGGELFSVNENSIVTLTGSGQFYTSAITIINTSTGVTASYVTASNTPISASFSGSSFFDRYSILASTETLAGFNITFSSSANIPVSPTGSLDAWNTYLNTTASLVSSNGNTFSIAGGDISAYTTLNITSSGVTALSTYGMTGLTSYNLYNNKLTSIPSTVTAVQLTSCNLNTNLITGSLSLDNFNNGITYLNVSNNKLSGSIPNPSSSYNLLTYDLHDNYFTGSIDLQGCYNLAYFNASNNRLSGSFNIENTGNITYFSASNNHLVGNIPALSVVSYPIQYFNVSNNKLTGSLDISYATYLKYLDVSNNNLTGGVSSFTNAFLEYFNCSNNQMTASFPLLQTVDLTFTTASFVSYYNISNNNFYGTINYGEFYNAALETFICNDNQLDNYTPVQYSSRLKINNFLAQNNVLASSAVDAILYDLDASPIVSGTVNLSGTGNQSPSATGYTYTASLKSKGWTVYTN